MKNETERKGMDIKAPAAENKNRHEFKYLCTEGQLAILKARLDSIMKKDSHAGRDGKYFISSLYFDNADDRCFCENEDGNGPREKFRIRIYNNCLDRISLECKRKENDKVSKKSCILTRELFEYLTYGKGKIDLRDMPFLAAKLSIMKKTEGMAPKAIVSYERTPYVYPYGNVRVTFDRNITSSRQIERFGEKAMGRRLILPTGTQLLEVKYDEYLPDPIYHALSLRNMERTTFSKYYLCRKYHLL